MERCNFYVGQKVVCVDDSYGKLRLGRGDLDGLRRGEVYTVRELSAPHPAYPIQTGQTWVYLEEITRPLDYGGTTEVGYAHWRFRPATDISALEALLKTAKPPAKVRQTETT